MIINYRKLLDSPFPRSHSSYNNKTRNSESDRTELKSDRPQVILKYWVLSIAIAS
ncbi:hypothetical protein NDI43_09295 [Microcoleus vaginatus GB2-A3]